MTKFYPLKNLFLSLTKTSRMKKDSDEGNTRPGHVMAGYSFWKSITLVAVFELALPMQTSLANTPVTNNPIASALGPIRNSFQSADWSTGAPILIAFALLAFATACLAIWQLASTSRANRLLEKAQNKLTERNEQLKARADSQEVQLTTALEEHHQTQNFAEIFFNQSQSLNMIAKYSGEIIRLNSAWKDMLGFDPRNKTDMVPREYVHPDDREPTAKVFKQLISGEDVDGYENRWSCLNGEYRHLRWSARTDPERKLIYAVAQDVTEQKAAEAALKLNASVFTFAHEGIFIADSFGRILDVNSAFTEITGFALADVRHKHISLLSPADENGQSHQDRMNAVNADGVWRGELSIFKAPSEPFPALMTLSAVENERGHTTNYIGLFSNISKIKDHEKALEQLARHDKLTGLPNRDLLNDRITQAMARARRHDMSIAVAFIDLDGFKAVNDTYGHSIGDALLVAIARRLKAALRIEDTLARIGGDEFIAVITDLHNERDCIGSLERILAAASEQFNLGPITTSVSASIGIAFYPQEEVTTAEQLERQADQAMYEAKLAGGNNYRFFDISKDKALATYHTQLAEAQTALDKEQFRLFYQPKVDLETGLVIGCEALLRWQHPEKGLLLPRDFLPPIRKHAALVMNIGNWVLDRTLRQIAEWQDQGLDLNVSINLSGLQIMAPDFGEVLKAHLDRYPSVSAEHLEIEFVESDILLDITIVQAVMKECQKLGLRFALDDFGTGFSSLTCLKELPINTLKIDQELVLGSPGNDRELEILKTIISMGKIYDLDILAEGIETESHANWLRMNGCRYGQGNAIAEPMPPLDIPDWYGHRINRALVDGGLLDNHQKANQR